MSFHKRLYQLRKGKGLSQDELGGELNVSRQTISKWESGETTPELEKLVRISEYFGVSLDSLINDTGERETPVQNKEGENADHKPRQRTLSKFWRRLLVALLVIIGTVIFADIVVMLLYFVTNGFPA